MNRITKYLSLTILFICFNSKTSAQQNIIDSLSTLFQNAKHDTIKLSLLFTIIENIDDDNVWPKYNDRALKLSNKLVRDKNEKIKKRGKKGLADAYNNIGYLSIIQGNIPTALESFEKCIKIDEEINDKNGIATTLNNLATIYDSQGNIPKALEYYSRCLKLMEEIGDKKGISVSLHNIGLIYKNQGDLKKAFSYYTRSLKIREDIDDKIGIANSLNKLGNIYDCKGNKDKALTYYNNSVKLMEEIGDKRGLANAFLNIGNIYFSRKNYSLSNSYFKNSLLISKELGFPQNIRNAEEKLSLIDAATNNFIGAFEHYKQFIIYRDSLNNETTRKASIKNQLKYEFEKKEAVIKEQQEKERAIAEEKNHFQQIVILSVLIGLCLVLVFAAFVFRTLKITRYQKLIIEEKQKEILDSIRYAKRIQLSLLPSEKYIDRNLQNLHKNK